MKRNGYVFKISVLYISIIFINVSCPWRYTPVEAKHYNSFIKNLSGINTEYDDYNMAAPAVSIAIPGSFETIYSTNRKSNGGDFDVWKAKISITVNGNEISLSEESLGEFAPECNSSSNELGPYVLHKDFMGSQISNVTIPQSDMFYLFASDRAGGKGGLDIYFTDSSLTNPKPVLFDTSADEAYPTYYPPKSRWYFCSNRTGKFSIYSIYSLYNIGGMGYWLEKESYNADVDLFIESDGNDKCPYINNNMMVFVSDKSGGFGGFDIYYRLIADKQYYYTYPEFTEIANIGDFINTQYNEYRPSIYRAEGYDYGGGSYSGIFLIFSSDRPGGKGGYDLYLAYFELKPEYY